MCYQGGNLSEVVGEKHIYNRFKYILHDLKDARGSLLVIGSGDGVFEKLLKKVNSDIHISSIDSDRTFQDKLSRVSDAVIIDDFLVHNFNRTYDWLVSIDVIEHVIDTDTFLKKAFLLLGSSGYFYLQTPNLASWHSRLSLLFGYTPEAIEVSMVKSYFGKFWIFRHENAIHHVRVFTYRALREMCTFYGFKVEKVVGVDHRVPILFKPFPKIAGSMFFKLHK